MACAVLNHAKQRRQPVAVAALLAMSQTFLLLEWTKSTDMVCTKVGRGSSVHLIWSIGGVDHICGSYVGRNSLMLVESCDIIIIIITSNLQHAAKFNQF